MIMICFLCVLVLGTQVNIMFLMLLWVYIHTKNIDNLILYVLIGPVELWPLFVELSKFLLISWNVLFTSQVGSAAQAFTLQDLYAEEQREGTDLMWMQCNFPRYSIKVKIFALIKIRVYNTDRKFSSYVLIYHRKIEFLDEYSNSVSSKQTKYAMAFYQIRGTR
jgi:hypothetical protein